MPMPYLQYEVLNFNFQRGKHQFKFDGVEYDYEVWSSKKDRSETIEALLTFTIHDTISVRYSSVFPYEGYYTVSCSKDHLKFPLGGYYIPDSIRQLIEGLYPVYEYLIRYQEQYIQSHRRLNLSKAYSIFEKNSLSYLRDLNTKEELLPYLLSPLEVERIVAEKKIKALRED